MRVWKRDKIDGVSRMLAWARYYIEDGSGDPGREGEWVILEWNTTYRCWNAAHNEASEYDPDRYEYSQWQHLPDRPE